MIAQIYDFFTSDSLLSVLYFMFIRGVVFLVIITISVMYYNSAILGGDKVSMLAHTYHTNPESRLSGHLQS